MGVATLLAFTGTLPIYAFDPRRCAILLIGGDKTGIDNRYEIYVRKADTLLDVHLKEISEENPDG